MIKKYLVLSLLVLFGAASFNIVGSNQVFAAENCEHSFLTLPPWYRGLTNTDCSIKSPKDADVGGLGGFITTVLLNVGEMLTQLAGYAAVAFILYGGFRYMTSQGEASGIQSAKKTITNASIGLLISILAVTIIKFIFSTLEG